MTLSIPFETVSHDVFDLSIGVHGPSVIEHPGVEDYDVRSPVGGPVVGARQDERGLDLTLRDSAFAEYAVLEETAPDEFPLGLSRDRNRILFYRGTRLADDSYAHEAYIRELASGAAMRVATIGTRDSRFGTWSPSGTMVAVLAGKLNSVERILVVSVGGELLNAIPVPPGGLPKPRPGPSTGSGLPTQPRTTETPRCSPTPSIGHRATPWRERQPASARRSSFFRTSWRSCPTPNRVETSGLMTLRVAAFIN